MFHEYFVKMQVRWRSNTLIRNYFNSYFMRSCANQTVDNILISIPSRGRVSSFRAQSQRCKAWWTMFTNYAVAPVLQTNYQLLLYGHCTYQNNNNGSRVINTNYASTQRTLLFLNFTTLLWYDCNMKFFVSFVRIFE